MSMPHYDLVVYWSGEDAVYVAEVPDLPGCSAHGDSPSDAVSNATDAMRAWLRGAEEAGIPFPTPTQRVRAHV